jgi:hypothetical protein
MVAGSLGDPWSANVATEADHPLSANLLADDENSFVSHA